MKKTGLKLNIQKTKIMASSPITSWEIVETVSDFIFLGSKITADGDCSHEIKRCLLLGRKAMTNLDSILSRDVILPTKVRLVKAVVFPMVMYGCELDHKESWALKNWCFWLWCWRRPLRVSWTARRSNQSILKEISPEYSLEELMLKLKLQYFGHLMWPNWCSSHQFLMWETGSLENTLMLGKTEARMRRGMTEDKMVKWYHWLNGHEFKQALGNEGRGSLACCIHGVSKLWTWLSD